MKKLFLFIATALLLVSCGKSTQTKQVTEKPQTGWEEYELTGKVKALYITYDALLNEEVADYNPLDPDNMSVGYYYSLLAFCDKHELNFVYTKNHPSDAEEQGFYYENPQDFIYEQEYPLMKIVFDEAGNATNFLYYDSVDDDNPAEQIITQYDDNHRIVRCDTYDDNMIRESYEETEYNADGFAVSIKSWYAPDERNEMQYTYDEYNNQLSFRSYLNDDMTYISLYEYDKHGNNTVYEHSNGTGSWYDKQQKEFVAAGGGLYREKNLVATDKQGNILYTVEYDYTNDFNECTEYHYAQDGTLSYTVLIRYGDPYNRENITYRAMYNAEGEAYDITEFAYDKHGNQTFYRTEHDNSIYEDYSSYNSNNQLVEQICRNSEYGDMVTKYTYEYTAKCKLKEKRTYIELANISYGSQLAEREVYTYDTHGNKTLFEDFLIDLNGTEHLMDMMSYEYEY